MKKDRVELLDSFRFLAILAVMLGHYTYRWTTPLSPVNLYPYGNFYGDLFEHGPSGVLFFFIISGFVISYTLENTSTLAGFFKNRFIRLFPPMLLCSVATFLICIAMDNQHFFPYAHIPRNFLPSLTFTNPAGWTVLTHKEFSYISLSYWTLWVEVQFYIVAALIYFSTKKQFLNILILLTVVLNILQYVPDSYINPESYHLPAWLIAGLAKVYYNSRLFDLRLYISWFTIGAIFHRLYKERRTPILSLTIIGGTLIFLNQLYLSHDITLYIIYTILILFFVCMIYWKSILVFLDNPLLRRCGVISYTVYLIHEILGVLLIYKFGGYLGNASPLAPFIVIPIMFALAEMSYRFYEKKASKWLKSILFRPKKMVLATENA